MSDAFVKNPIKRQQGKTSRRIETAGSLFLKRKKYAARQKRKKRGERNGQPDGDCGNIADCCNEKPLCLFLSAVINLQLGSSLSPITMTGGIRNPSSKFEPLHKPDCRVNLSNKDRLRLPMKNPYNLSLLISVSGLFRRRYIPDRRAKASTVHFRKQDCTIAKLS